jgi:hypothetical protein
MTKSTAKTVLAILAQNLKPIDAWRLSWVSKAIPRPRGRFLRVRGNGTDSLQPVIVDIGFRRWPARIAIRCEQLLVFQSYRWRCNSIRKPFSDYEERHAFCAQCRLRLWLAPEPWEMLVHVDPADEKASHTYRVVESRQNELDIN